MSATPALERSAGCSAYAGVGSRSTPAQVLALIEALAGQLARAGWVLRTGLSPGADQAFYRGARAGAGVIELFLPWPGFEAHVRDPDEGGDVRELPVPSRAAQELAARFYRAWDGRPWELLDERERALLARDVHQVLGADLRTPARRVLCWTPDGDTDGEDPRGQGTGQALRVARHHEIPALNLARPDSGRRLRELGLSVRAAAVA